MTIAVMPQVWTRIDADPPVFVRHTAPHIITVQVVDGRPIARDGEEEVPLEVLPWTT